MTGKLLLIALASVLPMLIFSTPTAQAGIPPAIDISDQLMDGELLSIHKKMITNRVRWWKQKFIFAGNDKEVIAARNGLLGDYLYSDRPNYGHCFAEICNRELDGLLSGKDFKNDDPLRTQKIINAAIAMARMHHSSIQPALEIMVADRNEAVRFVGWEGYLATRNTLLLSGKKYLDMLAESLKKAGRNETNPLILNAALRTMRISASQDTTLNKQTRQSAQKLFLKVLQTSWNSRRGQVQAVADDDSDLLGAMCEAVKALTSIGVDLRPTDFPTSSPQDADSRLCLQMILDMAQSSALAFDQAWKKKDGNEKLLSACSDLLLSCETGLTAISGLKSDPIAKAADLKKEVPARGAAVQEAVLVTWTDALKKFGITEPKTPPKK